MTKRYSKSKRTGAVIMAAALATASMAAETYNLTPFIKNNSFESNFDSWTQSEMKVQNNSTFPLKDGNNYVEKWVAASSQAGNCSVSQTVFDLLPGSYTLTVSAQNHREGSGDGQEGVWIFAGGNQTPVGSINDYTVNFEVGADGRMTIGYKAQSATGNYLAVDNFRLTLLQVNTDALATYVQNFCNKANAALGNKVASDIAAALRTQSENLKAAADSGDINAIVTAVLALRTALENAEASTQAFTQLKTAVDKLEVAYEKTKNRPDAVETRTMLDQAITMYNEATATSAQVQEMTAKLNAQLAKVNEIITAFTQLQTALTKLESEYEAIKDKPGTETIKNLIEQARAMIAEGTASAAEALAMKAKLETAMLLYRVDNTTGQAPRVVTEPYIARGSTFALGRCKVNNYAGTSTLETGFCWSTNPEPTIADNRTSKAISNNGTIYHITGLEPSTVYYMRAYSITRDYAVGYGDVVKVITIPSGQITWSYNDNGGDEATNTRIKDATESAVHYWNISTSIRNWHATVNNSPGTPTADCSYGGWIRVGANTSYQRTGTLLHEMNHGVGVGQLEQWFGPNSPYRQDGTRGAWLGQRATKIVRFLENSTTAILNGDNTHMWPYGINGAHEDTGAEILYLANGLITQALGEDGLPPVANAFHTPCYYFPCEDGVKYYLKVEDASLNTATNYAVEGDDRIVKWTVMDASEAINDDHAAWYIKFNPVTCYYTFQNVASGNYLVMNPGYSTRVQTMATPAGNENPNFQITGSIQPVQVGTQKMYTYWISGTNKTSKPGSLAVMPTTGKLAYNSFSTASTSARQRWHILSQDQLAEFDAATGITDITAEGNATFPADIYDVTGRIVKVNAMSLEGLSTGVYIVNGSKVFVK